MKRTLILVALSILTALAVLPAGGGIGRFTTPALAQTRLHVPTDKNKCPQYGYKHPYCKKVPKEGCFDVAVVGKPIVLEGCEPKNGKDAGHNITTNPINNPCPTVPGGPNHAGSFVLHSNGAFPPLSLKAPRGGKLYQVNPGVKGSGACTPIARIVAPGTYEVVYPGASLATPVRKKK